MTPIRIHPDNQKLFEFRGRPLVLVTATEHYGAVMNRPFRYQRYLQDAAARGITLTRLFVLFRELQAPTNPYSTCKPESPDYVSPFLRTGPGTAPDGQPKYDLDRTNPEFWERLHGFLGLASDLGVIVEVTLLSNTYSPEIWSLNPLHHAANVNGLPQIPWQEWLTRRHPEVFARQVAHVRRVVSETRRYDNVIYEICNEPGGWGEGSPHPSREEVNAWQREIAAAIREADAGAGHLVSGQEAFCYDPWEQGTDRSSHEMTLDVVNVHPLPGTALGGKTYDMGAFMSKRLRLRAVRDFCRAAYALPQPINLDEDNAASQYKDREGWTIHRKRAWTALLCGAHYDYIDFSIINYCERGTPQSRRHIRAWMGHLAGFVHSLDLARARPAPRLVQAQPEHTVEAVLAVPGEDYRIYLADERELDEPGAGDPLRGDLVLDLPEGGYRADCFSPETGLYSPAVPLTGGPGARLHLPEFRQDVAVRIVRG